MSKIEGCGAVYALSPSIQNMHELKEAQLGLAVCEKKRDRKLAVYEKGRINI